MSNPVRRSEQRPRLLEPQIIDGLEKRLTAAQDPAQPLREVYELRAIGRELVGHIRALEEAGQTD